MIKKIGIALAAYKVPIRVFEEQLKSIQHQSYSDWFCVITFDSPISEISSAEELSPYFRDPRFIFLENKTHLGHKKNFEKAINECLQRGAEAIACSDQDDIWYEKKLERSLEELNSKKPLSLVHTDMHLMKDLEFKREISEKTVWEMEQRGVEKWQTSHLMIRNVVAGAAMLMDANLARLYPKIPDGFLYHDWWYAVVASQHGGITAIHEPLYAYRQHDSNVVGATPFVGLFARTQDISQKGVIQVSRNAWALTQARAKAVVEIGMPVSLLFKWLYLWHDLGLNLFLMGIFNLFTDRPLARSCFARALGKMVSTQ